MKLLFAHDHIFYECNGLFYSTGGLSKKMFERYTECFEEVVVISRQKTINKVDNRLTLATTDKVKFVKVPEYKTPTTIINYFKAKKIVSKEIEKCDALIARLPSTIGNLAVASAKENNKSYLIELVACPWDAHWNHSLKGKIIAPYMYLSTKKNVRDSKFVIYVTNEFLQSRYPTKGTHVNCSNVELQENNINVLNRRIERIKYLNNKNKIIIGTTAAVNVRYKGQQYIIRAIGELKKQGIEKFEYQLIGQGDQSYLSSLTKKYDVVDQVKFLGTIDHKEVFNWLETIDIYTQPSKQEGLPRALIEAMSCGLPAFGAKTAGIPELLDSDYVFSNTRRNIDEICKILLNLTKKSMAEQAIKNFEESKKYDKNIIDIRRKDFFMKFKAYTSHRI